MRGSALSDRARNWVFTINNYNDHEIELVKGLAEKGETCKVIAELETGEQGTPHIQGYVSFINPIYRSTLEIWLGGRAFIQRARGGWVQNFTYCSKDNTVFVKKGEITNTPKVSSTVTNEALESMKTMSCREFQDNYPNIWFWHRSKVLATMLDWSLRRCKNWTGELKEKNYWIWGEPGIGKSKWATELAPIDQTYKKNCNKWWDGFSFVEHSLVIIEDYPEGLAGNILVQFVKIWGDRYPFQGEVKGSSMLIQPGRFNLIITSNYPIDRCFLSTEDKEAIKRRFTEFWVTQQNKVMLLNLKPNRDLLDH